MLFKVEHHATEPCDGDIAAEGIVISGPGWDDRLRDVLAFLSPHRGSAPACSPSVLGEEGAACRCRPPSLLDRARTDWFPKFLSQGQMAPVFQPIVDLRERLGLTAARRSSAAASAAAELRGAELVQAAEAHDALYSFDSRTRAASLEVGLPMLPRHELLFVKLDPRGVHDVDSSRAQRLAARRALLVTVAATPSAWRS